MKFNISKEWIERMAKLEEGCEIGAGCPPTPFEMWFSEVVKIARLLGWKQPAIESIDTEAWKEYFDEGYSPADAWREEYDAAQ